MSVASPHDPTRAPDIEVPLTSVPTELGPTSEGAKRRLSERHPWEDTRSPTAAGARRGDHRHVRSLALFASDCALVLCVTVLAWAFSEQWHSARLGGAAESILPSDPTARFLMLVVPMLMLVGMSHGAGHYTRLKPLWLEIREFLKISFYTISGVAVALYLLDEHFSRLWFVSFWSSIIVLLPLSRLVTKKLLMRHGKWFRPVVVFGTGMNACKSAEAIRSDPMLGLRVVAFVRTAPREESAVRVPDERIVELEDWMPSLGEGLERQHFLFAPDTTTEFERNRLLLNRLSSLSRSITISPPFYGLPLDGAEIVNIPRSDSVLLRLQNNLAKRHSLWRKRSFDVLGSSLALLLLALPLAVLVALVKGDGGPAFYRQRRIGRNGVPFDCWKLRSMVVDSESVLRRHLAESAEARREWMADQKLRDDPRVTRIGRFLRATSLDELPQLWNVLRGDMSLVGPRPIVLNERERYGQLFSYYLSQSPGITGLWQISGRNDTTYERRVDLDVWYSRNWSFWLDLVILARTVPVVCRRSGAY